VGIVSGGGGGTFNGGTITEALNVEPGPAETDPAITADATGSGNTTALQVNGRTILDESSVGGLPLSVQLSGAAVLVVDGDGKTKLTPTTNGTSAQPALDVDGAAAINTLLRLRTNGTTLFTVDKAGTLDAGAWLFSGDSGTQIVASGAGSDIELCDSGSNIVVQVTDTGHLGFFNHAAAAQQSLTSGTATPEQIALALQANGFCGGT
jgi:hypothetical protein